MANGVKVTNGAAKAMAEGAAASGTSASAGSAAGSKMKKSMRKTLRCKEGFSMQTKKDKDGNVVLDKEGNPVKSCQPIKKKKDNK
tara:strand:+ start:465 stop:719 length:255 start_codon:yes stop_codon:yes gene_type:complete